jgi:hypothetical protein
MSTSGKYLKGRFGVTPASAGWPANGSPPGIPVKGMQEWSAAGRVDDLNGTDSESAGFNNSDAGVKKLTVTIQLVINTNESSFPGLQEGQLVQDLMLYASGFNVAPLYDLPYGLVTEASPAVQVSGQVRQTITVVNKGVYAGPLDPVVVGGSPYKVARPVASPDS